MTSLRTKLLAAATVAIAAVAPAAVPAVAAETVTASTAGTKPVGAVANVWGTASDAPNRPVWTEIRLDNGAWARSQSSTTASNGYYAIPLTYGSTIAGTTTWRVAVDTGSGVVRSNTFTFTRTGSVVASSAGTKLVNQTSSTWGTVAGAPDAPVWTEVRLSDGRWVRSQSSTTNASGGFVIPLTYGAGMAGTYSYRVAATTGAGVVRSEPFAFVREGWVEAHAVDSKGTSLTTSTWGIAHGLGGRSVWTEVRLSDGSWSRSQTRTATSNGGFTIPLTYGADTPGTYTYRVAAAGPDGTVRSGSFTLTRTGHALDLRRWDSWIKIAECESNQRWNINTGNGYHGGLQFDYPTWHSVDGGDFAQYPHQATREEQITVANRLYEKRGFQPWSCRRVL